MLARSFVALLCGSLAAVAAYPNEHFEDHSQTRLQFAEAVFDSRPWPAVHQQHPTPPGSPSGPPKFPDKTIYEVLKDDDRFSRIFKLINFADDIAKALNDPGSTVTFFAPPDHALRPPPHKHDDEPPHRHSEFNEYGVEAFFNRDVITSTDQLELIATLENFVDDSLLEDDEGEDDEDKKRKRKIIKAIVSAVLRYHIIGVQLHAADLAKNTTFPSSLILGEGSLDGKEFRIRVEQPNLLHPGLTLNFYAKVTYADVETKNGIIHAINHPLFPPPSTFPLLFALPGAFATLTSAIQRVDLTDAVDWHWNRESKTLEGSPAVTFFAPTNAAFDSLPRKLKLFLFSPFGARALKKILAYHTVPEFILHSNWVHNATDSLQEGPAEPESVSLDNSYVHMKSESFQNGQQALRMFSMAEEEFDRHAFLSSSEPTHLEVEHHGFPGGDHQIPPRAREGCRPTGERDAFPPPPPGPPRFAEFPHPRRPGPCECTRGLPHPPPHLPPHHPSEPAHPHPHPPILKPVYSANLTLPTALGGNYTLNVTVAQLHSILPHGYVTKVFVNGQWVVAPDVPTRNGAVHVVKRLIKPPRGAHGGEHGAHRGERQLLANADTEEEMDQEWEDWEEWLPQWANED
ncbi:FAS1 domain-containing protein [Trametopsis cervina]|nr:FAS1 domain-containing protein [Trametopsis cervina]